MSAPLPHATLKAKQRELRQGFPEGSIRES